MGYGGDLKAGYCLVRGRQALVGHYFGDLEQPAVYDRFRTEAGADWQILHFRPTLLACDKHPGYFSSRLARTMGQAVVGVQHHVAHAASVAAEHRITGPCLAVVFDGTGYGDDGSIWGGEFFRLAADGSYRRSAHLESLPVVGGDALAKDAARTAACLLMDYGLTAGAGDSHQTLLAAALATGTNTVRTSSMGRLFDAVSALLGLGRTNSYEGRCAILLEQAAARALHQGKANLPLEFDLSEQEGVLIASPRAILAALLSASDAEAAALGFHVATAALVVQVCEREKAYSRTVLLSGGVFQNRILTRLCRRELAARGFNVYMNEAVPPGDGGICLGQAYLTALAQQQSRKEE